MARGPKIIDGKKLAAEIREEIGAGVKKLSKKSITPGLAVVLVGDDPASHVYVRNKHQACLDLGMNSYVHRLPKSASARKILGLVKRLNADKKVHGILVQSPLPDPKVEAEVVNTILPEKDVDGFHPVNVGKCLIGEECFLPCTPHGVQQMLMRYGYDPAGKHVVIVGRSNIVGKPLAALLVQKASGANATVTICHSRTKNLPKITQQGDILVAAIGVPEFITARMVKEKAVVIDVGMNRVPDKTKKSGFRLCGDVAFKGVSKKAKAITPVPGGVGPMTVTMLMQNTLLAAERYGKR